MTWYNILVQVTLAGNSLSPFSADTGNRQLAAMWLILGTVPTRDLYPHWHLPARLPERERASELLSQIKLQMTPSEIAKIEEMASNFFC